jgi:CRP-like cAMP-binding protein
MADAGEVLIEQWGSGRDFFVLLDGAAEVLVDGRRVDEIGPGGFFGEAAALDWGAGFGYPRLASVVTMARADLLVFPEGTLNELLLLAPSLGPRIRQALHDRVRRA